MGASCSFAREQSVAEPRRRPSESTIHVVGYAAGKGALNSFGRACAQAFAGENIRVNTVLPGLVLTPRADTVDPEMLRRFAVDIPVGRGGSPEEIAEAVPFPLSDQASYITGEEIFVAGGRR